MPSEERGDIAAGDEDFELTFGETERIELVMVRAANEQPGKASAIRSAVNSWSNGAMAPIPGHPLSPESARELLVLLDKEASKPGEGLADAESQYTSSPLTMRALTPAELSDIDRVDGVPSLSDAHDAASAAQSDSPYFTGSMTISHFHCNRDGCALNETIRTYQIFDLGYRTYRVNSRTDSHTGWTKISAVASCYINSGNRPSCHRVRGLPVHANQYDELFISFSRTPQNGRITVLFRATRHGIAGRQEGQAPPIYCSASDYQCKFDLDGDSKYG